MYSRNPMVWSRRAVPVALSAGPLLRWMPMASPIPNPMSPKNQTVIGYSHLAVVPWLVKRCCRARWALRSRIRVW